MLNELNESTQKHNFPGTLQSSKIRRDVRSIWGYQQGVAISWLTHSYLYTCLIKMGNSKPLPAMVSMNCSIPQVSCLQMHLQGTESIYSALLICKGPPLFLSQHRGSPSSLSYSLPIANLILLFPSTLTLAHRNCRSNALKLMFSELF